VIARITFSHLFLAYVIFYQNWHEASSIRRRNWHIERMRNHSQDGLSYNHYAKTLADWLAMKSRGVSLTRIAPEYVEAGNRGKVSGRPENHVCNVNLFIAAVELGTLFHGWVGVMSASLRGMPGQ
jgi:hypothetical protein